MFKKRGLIVLGPNGNKSIPTGRTRKSKLLLVSWHKKFAQLLPYSTSVVDKFMAL